MSKSAKLFLSVFILAAFLFASVSPALAAGERSITFLGAGFVYGKGVVFTFEVKGDFDSFGGTARIGGQDFRLICVFRDDGVLSCTMSQGGYKFIGQTAQINLNGYAFSGVIRPGNFCYNVFDWNKPEYSGDEESYWMWLGIHCQSTPAEYGDMIEYTSEAWGTDWPYTYVPGDLVFDFTGETWGDGYYYPPHSEIIPE